MDEAADNTAGGRTGIGEGVTSELLHSIVWHLRSASVPDCVKPSCPYPLETQNTCKTGVRRSGTPYEQGNLPVRKRLRVAF
jgi:hypothetical protein